MSLSGAEAASRISASASAGAKHIPEDARRRFPLGWLKNSASRAGSERAEARERPDGIPSCTLMIPGRVASTDGTWNDQLSVPVMSPDGGAAEETAARKMPRSDGSSRRRIRGDKIRNFSERNINGTPREPERPNDLRRPAAVEEELQRSPHQRDVRYFDVSD